MTPHLAAPAALVLALAACAPAPDTPEAFELANIRPGNVVPKSSPAQMVAAFETYCLAATPAQARAALRRGDYVQVARPTGAQFDFYVVDDRKPAVALHDGAAGSFCATTAEARTGQSNRVEDFVAARFAGARPVDPGRIGPGVERAWQTAGGDILYTRRSGPGPGRTSFTFAIWRAQ